LNFGRVLDQANDSAKALAVNTATNVAHGIFNLGAKAFSSVGAYLDKNAIFKDPDTLNTLSNGLTYDLNLIENITSRLIEENGSVQIYIPKPEEIQKSNSIISNSYKVSDKEKRLMLLKSAIELYPFSPEAYIEMIKIDFNFIFLFKNLLDELHLDFIDDFHKLLLDLIPEAVDYNDIKKLVKNLDDYQKLYNDSKSADFSSLIVSSVNKALIDKFNIRFDDSNFVEEDNLFVLYNSLIDSRNDLHVKRLDIPVIRETKSKLEECFISKESDILTTFDNTDSGITKVVDNLDEYLNHRKIQINSDVETKFIHIIVDYVVSKISVSIAQIESNCFEFSKDLLNKFDYYESYLLSNNGLIGKIKSEYSFYDKEFIDRLRVILFDTAKKFINSGIKNLLLKFNKLNSLSQVKIVIASANKLCDKFSIENPAVLSDYIDNAIFNIVSINPSSNYKTYSLEFLESSRVQCLEVEKELSISNSKALQIIDTYILENRYLNAVDNRNEILEVYGKGRLATYNRDFLLPYFDSFNIDISKESPSLKSQIIEQLRNFCRYRGRCSKLPFVIIASPLLFICLFQFGLWFNDFVINDNQNIMFPLIHKYISYGDEADFYLNFGLYIPLFLLFIMHWIICRRILDLSKLISSQSCRSSNVLSSLPIGFYLIFIANFCCLFFILTPLPTLVYLCCASSFQKPNNFGSLSSGQINPDDIFDYQTPEQFQSPSSVQVNSDNLFDSQMPNKFQSTSSAQINQDNVSGTVKDSSDNKGLLYKLFKELV
jgi:hypothetical protein